MSPCEDPPVIHESMRAELSRFDPSLPIERAFTPPASWYVRPDFLELERERVFRRSWQAVGRLDQVSRPGDYFTGCLVDDPYLVLRDQDGTLRAFHNVCRHHAAEVCRGEGSLTELVCPYHGWTYRLDGGLSRAPRLGQNELFDRETFSLKPVAVAVFGALIFIHLGENPPPLMPQFAELAPRLAQMETGDLRFVSRRAHAPLSCRTIAPSVPGRDWPDASTNRRIGRASGSFGGFAGARPRFVWRNDGKGRFQQGPVLAAGNTQSLASGDLDGDGDTDIVFGNLSQPAEVWLNQSNQSTIP